jgi:hypothetical protein
MARKQGLEELAKRAEELQLEMMAEFPGIKLVNVE